MIGLRVTPRVPAERSRSTAPGSSQRGLVLLSCLLLLPSASCKPAPVVPLTDGAYSERNVEQLVAHRNGPSVRLGSGGPARFVASLYQAFDVERAMSVVADMDGRIRTPGSPGYDATLDQIEAALRVAGFADAGRLRLETLRSPTEQPAWIPRASRVALVANDGREHVLHAFDDPADRDRSMLPRPVTSFDVRGPVAFDLETLHAGEILVTRTRVRRDMVNRVRRAGAVGIVSASLQSYNLDPLGRERHLDAIQHHDMGDPIALPVLQISERSFRAIEEEASRRGHALLAMSAEVDEGPRELRTLIATIEGGAKASEAVVLVSHVMDPGAADNASGASGQLEIALCIQALLERGELEGMQRTLVFLWGTEFVSSKAWLASTALAPYAAINGVMIGESVEATGAMPLLERYPDPGAVEALPPDQHTLWGRRDVDPAWLERPNGVSLVARCALADVGVQAGGWETSENPYEGGTDHQTFIEAGVPAVLFWHFTDFTFHTSLDRIEMLDPQELRRMAVAVGATALALAAPVPTDLERYLACNRDEEILRVTAAETAGNAEIGAAWSTWCTGVRHWFRALCLPQAE